MDTRHLLPGDIVFTRSTSEAGAKLSAPVRRAQRLRGAPASAARFSHASIYLGPGDMICEALPRKGVVERSIHEYADGRHALLVRRPQGLSLAERHEMATIARSYLGMRYDTVAIIHHGAHSVYRLFAHKPREWREAVLRPNRRGAFLCSTLCQDVLIEARPATNKALPSLVMPFHFIGCSLMAPEPVAIAWACWQPAPP